MLAVILLGLMLVSAIAAASLNLADNIDWEDQKMDEEKRFIIDTVFNAVKGALQAGK
jgi:hypothetical protein